MGEGKGEGAAFTLAEGATHVGNCANYRKSAFTLAEVLITLAIIGVVAAMTIPTLVANYQEKSWGTAATVFERKLTEAMRVMNANATLAGHSTTESFVNELAKNFKTTKICANDKLQDCFSSEVTYGNEVVDMTKVKKAKHFGQDEWGTEIIGTQFANGTTALIAYNPKCSQDPYSNTITGSDCLAILYDTSAGKTPNVSGKDLRANGNVQSLGGSSCAFEIDGTCFGMPFQANSAHTWNACNSSTYTSTDAEDQAYMQKYGLDYCYPGDDYFAKAAETCGGTSKMAQLSDLATIANYLYDTDIVGEKTDNGSNYDGNTIAFNPTKGSSLGFPSPSFWVWSGEEGSSAKSSAHVRDFYSDDTVWNYDARNRSGGWAVCLGD
ncbi:MAG: type II secretion system protein [Cyanobacteria bacterium SIG32]|nr:type II secretion system protein [Cyanobacteria bacterium SIG32]